VGDPDRLNPTTDKMVSTDESRFRLSVLNPGGRDLEQYFDEPIGPGAPGHPPINLHAFAACTNGAFHRATKNAIEEKRPILLVLRGNFRASERALVECNEAERTVAVALKETGLHQIAHQLRDPAKLSRFIKIVTQADVCIATTPEAAEIYQRVRSKHDHATVVFIPTPYPIEDQRWDFSIPRNEQSGIFIGTREWEVPSRNHFAALLVARELCEATGEAVTVVNLDGYKGRRLLGELNFPEGKLRLIDNRLEIPQISQGASDAFADFGLTVRLLLEQANDPLAICTSQAVRLNHQFANPDVVHRLRRARLSDSCAGQERGYEKSEQDAHNTSRRELEPLDESFRRRHHRTDLDRTANGPRLG